MFFEWFQIDIVQFIIVIACSVTVAALKHLTLVFQFKLIIVLFFLLVVDAASCSLHSYLMLTLLTLREEWILIVFPRLIERVK